MMSIKVMLSSNCSHFIHNIQLLTKQYDAIRLIGETGDATSLPHLVATLQPDILLLHMPVLDSNAISLLREVHLRNPGVKCLISSSLLRDELIDRALLWGAKGFLSTTFSSDTYSRAIHTVYAGDIWLSRKRLVSSLERLIPVTGDTSKPSSLSSTPPLTNRESEIIAHVIEGLTNKEIARQLTISDKTVKVHLEHIFSKLGINRRSQLFHRLHTANGVLALTQIVLLSSLFRCYDGFVPLFV